MSFILSVESDFKQLQKQLTALEGEVYPRAVARTLNRIISSAKAASAKHIAPQMNAKQADIKRRMIETKAHPKKLWASIIASANPLNLIAFKARQTAKGVVAKAWGVNKLYKHTFIAPVNHGSSTNAVYVRKSSLVYQLSSFGGQGLHSCLRNKRILAS